MVRAELRKKIIVLFSLIAIISLSIWEIYCIKWSVKEVNEKEAKDEYTGFSDANSMLLEYNYYSGKITLFYDSGIVKTFMCKGDFYDLYGLETNVLEENTEIEVLSGRIWRATPLEYINLKLCFSKINHENTPDNLFIMHDGYCHYIINKDEHYNWTDVVDNSGKQVVKHNYENPSEDIVYKPVVFNLKRAFVKCEYRRFDNVVQHRPDEKIGKEQLENLYGI